MIRRRSRRGCDAAVAASQPSTWRRRLAAEDGAAQLVQLVLLAPLLAVLMALLLHLGLYLMTRQAVLTATAEGLKEATVHGAAPTTDGPARALQVLEDHAPATDLTATASVDETAGTVTMTVTARAPAIAPGLPRTVSTTQTATHERWLP